MADFTRNVNVRQEVHLNGDSSIAGAILAAPALYVKAKATLLITTNLRLGSFREKCTDLVENSRIGCRVRSRCATNRRLINMNNLVELIYSSNCLMPPRYDSSTVEFIGKS